MRRRKTGFTLIELLIVVAIIGILAAIAIPNFLEAQVRAKVARTKADMQAIGTALEIYCVDENVYPTEGSFGPDGSGGSDCSGSLWNWNYALYGINTDPGDPVPLNPGSQLTTPIAYMSSIPLDVFNTDIQVDWIADEASVIYYRKRDQLDCDKLGNSSPWTQVQDPDSSDYIGTWMSQGFSYSSSWVQFSIGPSLQYMYYAYDPTNGTISVGGLYRFP